MNNIEKFKAAKQSYGKAKEFLSLIGRDGHCGAGKFHSVEISNLQIYHQETAGATNYHEASLELLEALDAVIMENLPELSKKALEKLKEKAEQHKAAAQAEYQALFGEALKDAA